MSACVHIISYDVEVFCYIFSLKPLCIFYLQASSIPFFFDVRRICRLGCQDINIPGSFRKIYDHEISHFKSHLERASSPDACILQLLYIPSLEPVRKSHHTVMWFENVMLHTYV